MLGSGLTAPASPGSIIAILAMCPKGGYLPVLAGVAAATAVSFAVALPLLKFAGKDADLEESQKKVSDMKPKGGYLPVLAGVAAATAVSFAVALPLLKFAGKDADLEESQKKVSDMKAESKGTKVETAEVKSASEVHKIVFACT